MSLTLALTTLINESFRAQAALASNAHCLSCESHIREFSEVYLKTSRQSGHTTAIHSILQNYRFPPELGNTKALEYIVITPTLQMGRSAYKGLPRNKVYSFRNIDPAIRGHHGIDLVVFDGCIGELEGNPQLKYDILQVIGPCLRPPFVIAYVG